MIEVVDVPTAEDMRALGARLAPALRSGQVVLLVGDLGAGKTTLTQGIARGLGVADAITSPTFVIAREHESGPGRPGLQHVDAYRLQEADDLADLDLGDAERITVVEWGDRLTPTLREGAVVVTITRSDDDADEGRVVRIDWPQEAR